jgi:hypothetical protein
MAGIVYGLLFVLFGVLAPVAAGLGSAIPGAFIGVSKAGWPPRLAEN